MAQAFRRRLRSERARWMLPLACIVLAAAILRMWQLDAIPPGLHGDEAISGLEGERILEHGSIGLYSPLALGQPAGPLYLVAPAVAVFGHSATAVRLAPAIMGTATVVLLFFVVRPVFGTRRALAASAVLAAMAWHIHFARTGFTVESWPFVVLLAVACLLKGLRSNSLPWYAYSGFATALGIYVYNANYIFILAMGIFLLGLLIARRGFPLGRDLLCVAMFGSALLGGMAPMAAFAADDDNGYFQQFRRDSLTSSSEWKQADSPLEQAELIGRRYVRAWKRLTFAPTIDIVDGLGFTPILPGMLVGLALVGMSVGLRRFPSEPFVWVGLVILVVTPMGVAITDDEGTARRLLLMTPFIATFAALALAEGWRFAQRLTRPALRGAALACMTLVAVACVWQNLWPYFHGIDNRETRWAYAHDFTEASRFMASLGPGSYIYLLSARHSINYETRLWLAPHVHGENSVDRATQQYRLDVDPARGEPVFVLIDSYRSHISEIEARYPNGRVAYGPDSDGGPAYIAYWPPAAGPAEPRD